MNSRHLLAYALLVGCVGASGIAASDSYVLLPPQQIYVAIEASQVDGAPTRVGEQYSVYIAGSETAGYRASVVDVLGVELYGDVPTNTERCSDSGVSWPALATAHVMSTRTSTLKTELVVYPQSLNPCLLILDLDLAGRRNTVPSKPNRGHPGEG